MTEKFWEFLLILFTWGNLLVIYDEYLLCYFIEVCDSLSKSRLIVCFIGCLVVIICMDNNDSVLLTNFISGFGVEFSVYILISRPL
jgi:hypothetical protein